MKHVNFVLVFRYKGQFTLEHIISCLSIKWENDYEWWIRVSETRFEI